MTFRLLPAAAAAVALCASAASANIRPPENANEHAAYFDETADFCAIFYFDQVNFKFYVAFNTEYMFKETSGGTSTSLCKGELAFFSDPAPDQMINTHGTCAYLYRDGYLYEGHGMVKIKPDGSAQFVCNTNRNNSDPLEFIEP